MFKLVESSIDYGHYVSEFKRQHNLSPLTSVSATIPLEYPCLIDSLKAFAKRPNKILRTGGAIDIVYVTEEVIENEIYYRSQAKKLVYPLRRQVAQFKSVKITSDGDLNRFIEAFWESYHRRYIDRRSYEYALQISQVNELCSNIDAVALPCIISIKNINIDIRDNLLIPTAVFPVLTKEEARSLVYYKKNASLRQKKQKSDIWPLLIKDIKRTKKMHAVGDNIPF